MFWSKTWVGLFYVPLRFCAKCSGTTPITTLCLKCLLENFVTSKNGCNTISKINVYRDKIQFYCVHGYPQLQNNEKKLQNIYQITFQMNHCFKSLRKTSVTSTLECNVKDLFPKHFSCIFRVIQHSRSCAWRQMKVELDMRLVIYTATLTCCCQTERWRPARCEGISRPMQPPKHKHGAERCVGVDRGLWEVWAWGRWRRGWGYRWSYSGL